MEVVVDLRGNPPAPPAPLPLIPFHHWHSRNDGTTISYRVPSRREPLTITDIDRPQSNPGFSSPPAAWRMRVCGESLLVSLPRASLTFPALRPPFASQLLGTSDIMAVGTRRIVGREGPPFSERRGVGLRPVSQAWEAGKNLSPGREKTEV